MNCEKTAACWQHERRNLGQSSLGMGHHVSPFWPPCASTSDPKVTVCSYSRIRIYSNEWLNSGIKS